MSNKQRYLTRAALHEWLHYDPATGIFTWARSPHPRILCGAVAGGPTDTGYIQIMIKKRQYLAHRLAWFYVTGRWPREVIDHRDGARSNNRFSNLRDVSRVVNAQNRHRCAARSGFLGVTKNARSRGYKATMEVNGRAVHLGSYLTAEDAHAAYIAGKLRYHPGYIT